MEKSLYQPHLDERAVRIAYRAWAPFYDYSFGVVSTMARRLAVTKMNQLGGRILEIGVGTGLALPRYRRGLDVTGIDLSQEMLTKAAKRVKTLGLQHITLSVMDAGGWLSRTAPSTPPRSCS